MRYAVAFATFAILGVYLLATLPVTDPVWHLAAGWGSLLAALICLALAFPEDVSP